MLDRFIQRDTEFLLHSSDAVEHSVSMGKKRFAGLLQRPAADQVIIERFAVLCALFPVARGKSAHLLRDQIFPPFQIFQQQRRAQLRNSVDATAVEAFVRHQRQCLACRAIERRKCKQIVNFLRHDDLELKFLRQCGKSLHIFPPVQKKHNISFV